MYEDDLDMIIEKVDGSHRHLIGKLSRMRSALAAWARAVELNPADRIRLRHRARIVRDSLRDRP